MESIEANVFDKLIELVEYGYSIRKALKILKIDTNEFYKKATIQQKAELKMAKISVSKHCGWQKSKAKINHD